MRVAVLADVHANLPALRAVLAALRAWRPERFVVAGDLVGYGPHPNQCIELLADLEATVVAGNHDLLVTGALTAGRVPEDARRSHVWTLQVLSDDNRARLDALPARAEVEGMVVAHGALDDVDRYIVTPADAAQQLRLAAAEHRDAWLVVLGHTHWAQVYLPPAPPRWLRPGRRVTFPGPRALINPGAVGQSRQLQTRPHARALQVDTDERAATPIAVPYDHRSVERDARAAGLPPRVTHRPTVRARWRLRRLLDAGTLGARGA